MRYVVARMKEDHELSAYRFYISDGMRALTGNTATENKQILNQSLYALLHPVNSRPEDSDNIINKFMKVFGATDERI